MGLKQELEKTLARKMIMRKAADVMAELLMISDLPDAEQVTELRRIGRRLAEEYGQERAIEDFAALARVPYPDRVEAIEMVVKTMKDQLEERLG